MAKKKVFAKGYCFTKIFIFFLIGCVLGTYYEEILNLVKTGTFSSRQGVLYGPFSPIYGVGVLVFVILLGKNNDKRSIKRTYLYSFLIGGITEFSTSFIAEYVFGLEFWDYSGYFLNIFGRTTVIFMLAWGVFGTILMKVVYPFVSKLVEKIPYKVGKIGFNIIFVLMMINLVLTYGSLGRMALRNNGVKPYTIVGEFFDEVYPNEYLYDKFPVMRPKKK